MKHDGVRRSVKSSRHARAAGDAPDLGRVSRMPGTGLPKGRRRKRRTREGGRGNRLREARRTIIRTWTVLLGILTLVALGVLIWLGIRKPQRVADAAAVAVREEKAVGIASRFPAPSEDEALALVSNALAVRDPARVPEFFRLATASPEDVVDLLTQLESREGKLERLEWIGSSDANSLAIEAVVVHLEGQDKPRNRLALLTPDPEGNWKIAFEAFARTVEPAWKEITDLTNMSPSVVRVFVAKDSYYNGPFADDQRWTCYGMASPDTEQIMWGYCEAGTARAAAMNSILSTGTAMERATLEIRRVEGGEPRQFEITRVLAQGWITGDAPFDALFE